MSDDVIQRLTGQGAAWSGAAGKPLCGLASIPQQPEDQRADRAHQNQDETGTEQVLLVHGRAFLVRVYNETIVYCGSGLRLRGFAFAGGNRFSRSRIGLDLLDGPFLDFGHRLRQLERAAGFGVRPICGAGGTVADPDPREESR
jgi:hypothetical protein